MCNDVLCPKIVFAKNYMELLFWSVSCWSWGWICNDSFSQCMLIQEPGILLSFRLRVWNQIEFTKPAPCEIHEFVQWFYWGIINVHQSVVDRDQHHTMHEDYRTKIHSSDSLGMTSSHLAILLLRPLWWLHPKIASKTKTCLLKFVCCIESAPIFLVLSLRGSHTFGY